MDDRDRRQDRDPSEPGGADGPRAGDAPGGAGPESGRADAGAADGGATGDAGPSGDGPGERAETGSPGGGPGPGGWSGAISEMQNLVGDVVGEVLDGVRGAAGRRFPRVDMVREADGNYVVTVDLPGVGRDEVRVATLGGELTISGERPRPELSEGSEVLRSERGYGGFRRTLRLPPDIREEDVSARLEDGVLEIRLPRKSASEARPVDIE